jgi:hypothetical protein
VLWRRNSDGFDEDPYCPKCKLVLAAFPPGSNQVLCCSSCQFQAPFRPKEIAANRPNSAARGLPDQQVAILRILVTGGHELDAPSIARMLGAEPLAVQYHLNQLVERKLVVGQGSIAGRSHEWPYRSIEGPMLYSTPPAGLAYLVENNLLDAKTE